MSYSLLVLILIYGSVDSFTYFYSNVSNVTSGTRQGGADPGEPLFLTPYVESGDKETGRKLASVPSDLWLGVESYAGFFTVDKDFGSNHFFWYFPSMTNAKDAPVILWLNSGPTGSSSLIGLFQENGPFTCIFGKKKKREITWATNHHMVYVDCPVGTGFSFTNSSKGYCTNEEQIGDHLYSSMTQFFQLFPELQKNDFYIVGQSYGGKFATALAHTIYKNNSQRKLKFNFKGVVIDNGWVDPKHQIWHDEYLNGLGKLDHKQAKILRGITKTVVRLINEERWKEANDAIVVVHALIWKFTGYELYNLINYSYLFQKYLDIYENENFYILFDDPAVRKSIHVGNLLFSAGYIEEVADNLKEDIAKSVTPWLHDLYDANYCDIIIYNGQLNIFETYPATERFIYKMNLTGYVDAKSEVWWVDDDVAGYVKKCNRLTQIMVRNSGQLVPRDQPYWAWKMITSITHKTGIMAESKKTLKGKNIND